MHETGASTGEVVSAASLRDLLDAAKDEYRLAIAAWMDRNTPAAEFHERAHAGAVLALLSAIVDRLDPLPGDATDTPPPEADDF